MLLHWEVQKYVLTKIIDVCKYLHVSPPISQST